MLQCKINQGALCDHSVRLAVLAGAALMLAGCGSLPDIPDAVNPLTWFEDEYPAPAPAAGAGAKKEFPKLSSVPARPPIPSLEAQQSKIKQGLAADQKNARYTDTQIRREANRRIAPVPAVRGPSVAPPPQSIPSPTLRPSSVPPPPVARRAAPVSSVPRQVAPPPPVARPVLAAPPLPIRRPAAPQLAARPAPPPVARPDAPPQRQAAPPPAPTFGTPGEPIKIGTIYFADNSKSLQRDDVAILRQVAQAQRSTGRTIRIVGHASGRARTFDPARRARINYQVSLDRANSIAAALAGMGVPTDRIQVEGAGDSVPIYAEYTAAGEAANRRAELFMLN